MSALPIVLYDRKFWRKLVNFEHLVETGMINAADLTLFDFADDPSEAWDQLLKHGLHAPAD
jgi:predicted Rossmann-fold nucleotide-binding protein